MRAQPGGMYPPNPGSNLGCGLTQNNQTAQNNTIRSGLHSSQRLAPRECFKNCVIKKKIKAGGEGGKCDKNANGCT